MIYDKLIVSLLSSLATSRKESASASIAHYLLTHASTHNDITVKGIAAACNVGVGSVSRFCRETGFESFDELRDALIKSRASFELAPNEHAKLVGDSLLKVQHSLDTRMLRALVDDIFTYEQVFLCGMLKAQAAAMNLMVDLLMLGKYAHSYVNYADQLEHIAAARREELVIVFSYTGTYFNAHDFSHEFARIDRPRIWMVTGSKCPQPDFVYGCLSFDSDNSQLTHPFQLEMVAARIAQEYARRA